MGARLVPFLLADGHKVTVLDTQWFGHGDMPDNGSLKVINGDVRDEDAYLKACEDKDAVIWLASLSNNEMYGIDYDLTHAVNTCVRHAPVAKFIYASSVAVLDPTSDYAKDKLACEKMLEGTGAIIVRAASACGYSAHQRFDLTINKMTHDACRTGRIVVNGGEQERSHVHLDDLCNFYRMALKTGVNGETYTVWALNAKIGWTAQQVADICGVSIVVKGRSDNRSYSVDGDSARSIGWAPKKAVWDAVRDLKWRFEAGYWPDSQTNPIYQNMADGLV